MMVNNISVCLYRNDIFQKRLCSDNQSFKRDIRTENYQKELLFFTGLSYQYKNKLYLDNRELTKVVEKYPNSKGIVGGLPSSWLKELMNFPKDERAGHIKDIYEAFGEAAIILRKNIIADKVLKEEVKAFVSDKQIKENCQEAARIIEKSLSKANILKEPVELRLIDCGRFGTAYFFKVNDKKLVFKVFHSLQDNPYSYAGLGLLMEANRGHFIQQSVQEHMGKTTDIPGFYFSDVKNGYKVIDFIDESSPEPEIQISEIVKKIGGIPVDDKPENRIEFFDIDHKVTKSFWVDPAIQLVDKELGQNKNLIYVNMQFLKNKEGDYSAVWDRLFNKKGPNYEDIKVGLARNLELLPDDVIINRFSKLLKSADGNFSKQLKYLSCIQKDKNLVCFEKFTENADDSLKDIIKLMPQDKGIILPDEFDEIVKDTNDINIIVKRILANPLNSQNIIFDSGMSKQNIIGTFYKIIEGSDPVVKKYLRYSQDCLDFISRSLDEEGLVKLEKIMNFINS